MLERRDDAIIAWRIWWYREKRLHPSLAGTLPLYIRATAWPPRDTPDARCPLGWHDAPPPHATCTCGYYAVKRLATALAWARARPQQFPSAEALVIGRVSLWGHVIEHEDGYRAQRAYPHLLYVLGPPGAARELADLYGVEAYAATWDEVEERAVRELSESPPPALARSLGRFALLRLLLSLPRLWQSAFLIGASMLAYGVWGLVRFLRYGVSDPITPIVFRVLYAAWIVAILTGMIGVADLAGRGYELELLLRSQRRKDRTPSGRVAGPPAAGPTGTA